MRLKSYIVIYDLLQTDHAQIFNDGEKVKETLTPEKTLDHVVNDINLNTDSTNNTTNTIESNNNNYYLLL